MSTEQVAHASRAADRGASTRATLLAAARDVFMQQGYAQAAITDIVAVAGASVGSLYHHFGGKADLYLALYEELRDMHEARTYAAVREAREAGIADPMQLLLAGARGYLDAAIERRESWAMFARGDGPPGFDLLLRQRVTQWVNRNTEFFARSGEPLDEAAAIVITGTIWLAVAEVSLTQDDARARELADGVLVVLARLGARQSHDSASSGGPGDLHHARRSGSDIPEVE